MQGQAITFDCDLRRFQCWQVVEEGLGVARKARWGGGILARQWWLPCGVSGWVRFSEDLEIHTNTPHRSLGGRCLRRELWALHPCSGRYQGWPVSSRTAVSVGSLDVTNEGPGAQRVATVFSKSQDKFCWLPILFSPKLPGQKLPLLRREVLRRSFSAT